MSDIKELTEKIKEFRDERDWKQYHNSKDMALSLSLEAAEVLEHFQWRNREEVKSYIETNKEDIAEELADVLYWVLLMSNDLGIDIVETSYKKLEKNKEKYPVEKSRGKNKKHTDL